MAPNLLESHTNMTGRNTGLFQVYHQIVEELEGKCVYVCVRAVSATLKNRRSNGQLVFALTARPSRKKPIDSTYPLPVSSQQTWKKDAALQLSPAVCVCVCVFAYTCDYMSAHTFCIQSIVSEAE